MKKIISLLLILTLIINLPAAMAYQSSTPNKKRAPKKFYLAIKNNDIKKVEYYLTNNYDPNEEYFGMSMIAASIAEKNNDILKLLIDYGADANKSFTVLRETYTPLGLAVSKSNHYAVKKLLENGADINTTHQNVPIIYGPLMTKDNEMLDILLSYNADINSKLELKEKGKGINVFVTPLIFASLYSYPYAIEKLLEAGANQKELTTGYTAEQFAIFKNDQEIIKIFNKFNKREYIENEAEIIKEALDALKENPVGESFYNVLMGENPMQKPFGISFTDLSIFNNDVDAGLIAYPAMFKDRYHIYIDNKCKDAPKEALASILGAYSISIDKEPSINEHAYAAYIMGTLWASYNENNNTGLRQGDNILVQTLNIYESDLATSNYDLSVLKERIANEPFYKENNLQEESPGFTNQILFALPEEKSKLAKAKESVIKYWKENNINEKLLNACAFIINTAMIVCEAMSEYYATQVNNTSSLTPVFMPAPEIKPAVYPIYGQNIKFINGGMYKQQYIKGFIVK